MGKDPAFLFYSKDWIADTAEFEADEKGIYADLLAHQHANGSLPIDEKKLAKICRVELNFFLPRWKNIEHKFIEIDGRLFDAHLTEVVKERAAYTEQQRIIAMYGQKLKGLNVAKDNKEEIRKLFKVELFKGLSKTQLNMALDDWFSERLAERSASLENENEDGNEDKIINKGESVREGKELMNKYKEDFENFRKEYPGVKRGLDIEFENLRKQHKDWKEIAPILFSSLQRQFMFRKMKKERKEFVPEWKHLKTYINQRAWEEYKEVYIEPDDTEAKLREIASSY